MFEFVKEIVGPRIKTFFATNTFLFWSDHTLLSYITRQSKNQPL